MKQLQRVVWSKGTFLSPQHLQAQDRYFEELLRFQLDAQSVAYWGFTRLQLNPTLLAEGQIAITEASGMLPDGVLFDVPECDQAPPVRNLQDLFRQDQAELGFYLGLPEHRYNGQNVGSQEQSATTRFYSEVRQFRDENTGQNEKAVQFAKKNLRIFTENENREGNVTLRLGVLRKTQAGTFELVAVHAPPTLDLHGNDTLLGFLRGLLETLIAKSSVLSATRRQKNQSLADFTTLEVANFWLLYTVNSHLPIFRHLYESGSVHPEVVYAEMLSLAGALTTFSVKTHTRDLPRYEHEDPGPCFAKLDKQIRELLETVVPTNCVMLPLKSLRPSIYAASIEKDEYLHNTRMYLGISAEVSDADLVSRTQQLVKVCSATHIDKLIAQALPGLKLTHVPQPPGAIPMKVKYKYFSIDQTGPVWEAVRRARNFAAYVPSDLRNPEIELVILLPQS